mmetsp:Transcript_14800/g.22422  ORF Transcript_14800/g.22422 Transcript_14800/m.22422 type:complete len:409 (-) Transcript_14800:261-1487(-)|eukprot:CAMPEP_0167741000 /NCGR_PEP_ID=MMETSP0110_2-20121227/611_1 /TAXON_ID=629695 /ORGANISM="Gymnochlora sp., Strain CCMP2014" /LENGTH=408 /DNA_ID=CAMNT_0007624999 /DNA_START=27 /DNA_END=1253 /DNA_ORIENTATION=+
MEEAAKMETKLDVNWHEKLSPEYFKQAEKELGSLLHMLNLTKEQMEKFKLFKKELGIAETGVPQWSGVEDDMTLYRFISGKQWVLKDALKQYRAMRKWREEEKMEKIGEWGDLNADRIELTKKYYPSCILGDDKVGRPVILARMGKIPYRKFVKTFTKEEWVMHHKWRMEKTIELLRYYSYEQKKPVTSMVVLVDMEGSSFDNRLFTPYMKLTAEIDKQNFPEIVGNVFMVRAPWVISMLYKLFKPFIDKRTRKKIKISSTTPEKTYEIVDEKVLPVAFGGKNPVELPQPLIEEKEQKSPVQNVPAGTEHSFVHKCDDPKGGTFAWVMNLESYDVTLKIEWTPEDSKESKTVLEAERVAEHEGEHKVKSKGTLKVTFDNTYSYLTSKDVQFGIVFHPGSGGDDIMEAP